MIEQHKRVHFVGIGGSGMSALAQLLCLQGCEVSGSDRSYDGTLNTELFHSLENLGIKLFPQDGSGVASPLDMVVISSAVEDGNPDLTAARKQNIPIAKRYELLADIFNRKYGIAIGGTSGKSTVTAMLATILFESGLDPTFLCGAPLRQFQHRSSFFGNMRLGASPLMCIEADESDGSLIHYRPKVSVITNISKDHKPIDELVGLFRTFCEHTGEALIINRDCTLSKEITPLHPPLLTFGMDAEADITAVDLVLDPDGSAFMTNGQPYRLMVPGLHNVSNALAAISAATYLEIAPEKIAHGLRQFKGIKRRLEVVGEYKGIKVYDDFSHNPAKLTAAIQTVKRDCRRLIVIFQPHGYRPVHFLKDELIAAFLSNLTSHDILIITEIFDAGGTADRTISAEMVVPALREQGLANSFYIAHRPDILEFLMDYVLPGDSILVMGARDPSLSPFCSEILDMVKRLSFQTAHSK